ncbi:MAG: glutamate formimidoyltransferase [Prevotellaceae bacterium]|jgi:glutamate formiminotransferase/formiminotetrahydrofolate cyclodeaminase|nr:glutamate formimidoyltransferase [Prevotellaceae bacterium]
MQHSIFDAQNVLSSEISERKESGLPVIECVPNFSEGRDFAKIRKIVASIEAIAGVKLLHIDTGADANRTVITFAGTPEPVCDAAFAAIKTASELIDMRYHHGKHPRIGSVDVCPLIPLQNITMDATVTYARKLARCTGEELGIPVYCYENAAFTPERKNLAFCRKGEYESLKQKLGEQKPDFGTDIFSENVAKTGATIIGARGFLAAVNFNLNTKSTDTASAIASAIREKGNGVKLKGIKAIGWYIDDFDIAQVSVNITDITATALHTVFEEVKKQASIKGVRVTGTEIIGMIPEQILLDAGTYFFAKDNPDTNFPKEILLEKAIQQLGLNDLKPFVPAEKILEYKLKSPLKLFIQ